MQRGSRGLFRTAMLFALAGLGVLAPRPCRAEDAAPASPAPLPDEGRGSSFNFTLENDLFNNGDDRNYTNGALLSWSSPRFDAPAPLEDIARRLGFQNSDFVTEVGLSQAMFAPRDLTRTTPDPADRPYAGITLLSMSLVGDTPVGRAIGGVPKNARYDQLAYYVGVVGPASGADRTQKFVHRRLDATYPEGWGAQIPDRVVGGLAFQSTRNLNPGQATEENHNADLLWHYGFSLGSVTTNAEIGVTLRAGYRMPRDFGVPRLAPSLPGSGYFASSHPFGFYVFAGAAQRYVAYDVTLDERPSRGAGLVDRRDWVSDEQAGLLAYAGCFRVGYTHVWRSEQFRGQHEGSGFGAVAISYNRPHGKDVGWLGCR